MLIRLEHKGVHLFEVGSEKIGQGVDIGRSSQCAWRVPADDKDVSSKHARLTLKGDEVWLEDLGSSNGTYFHGKTVKKIRLNPGMQIGIGGCLLIAEEGSGAGPVEAAPEIVMLSGKSRGERRELRTGTFTIGSDPGSSLTLLDMLVSRHHAEISVKEDGSCWIKDLGSKNGTTVNDAPLRADQERLLKEGDKITFAQYEARFYDGTNRRPNKKVWLRLGIAGATILVVSLTYAAVMGLKPSAVSCLAAARSAAAAEDFSGVRKNLDRAAHARGAETRELEISDMSRLVTVWETTLKTWRAAQDELKQGDWVSSSRDLGLLCTLKQDAWTWRPDATDEKNSAYRAKAVLDTLLHAAGVLNGEETGGSSMRDELAGVKKVLAENAGTIPDHLSRARTELVELQGKLELFLSESGDFERALDNLALWPPPITNTIRVLDETFRNSRGLLKRRSELMLDPVRALARGQAELNNALRFAQEMRFTNALAIEVPLPSTSACALDSRVSAARAAIENAHEKLQTQISQITYLFRELAKFVPDPDDINPPAIAAWSDKDGLNRMLNCDSFANPMPRRSRKEPSGQYDRYLGIEEFYEFIVATSLRQPWKEKPDSPFQTVLSQTRGIVDSVDAIQSFFAATEDWSVQLTPVNASGGITRLESGTQEPPAEKTTNAPPPKIKKETEWLLAGKLADRVKNLRQILALRDQLVASMTKIAAENSGDRPGLIAAGIACRLAENPAALKIGTDPVDAFVIRHTQDNRARLRDLGQQYDLADPAKQIALRDEILKLGIPGDPIVKRMWASFTATQK